MSSSFNLNNVGMMEKLKMLMLNKVLS